MVYGLFLSSLLSLISALSTLQSIKYFRQASCLQCREKPSACQLCSAFLFGILNGMLNHSCILVLLIFSCTPAIPSSLFTFAIFFYGEKHKHIPSVLLRCLLLISAIPHLPMHVLFCFGFFLFLLFVFFCFLFCLFFSLQLHVCLHCTSCLSQIF